jgi:C4-dicarboxylate-specific signal transduction histidine kinase
MQAVSTLTQLAGGSVSLLLLGFSFALLQSRLRQKERWGQQLEAQVNARTQELEESRAGLERQAQQLASFNQKLEETVRERTVKQMTENYGGRIEVESRLDEGTQFKVYFPG